MRSRETALGATIRLFGAWIADDVCACEAFFIEGKTKSEPCGLPKRGALPVFAFACACGL